MGSQIDNLKSVNRFSDSRSVHTTNVMPQESLIGKIYAPAIIADSIHSSGYVWLERAIIDREYDLEEQQLWEFIYNTRSTYSIAVILKGDYSGAYLLQLKSTASNGMDMQIPAVPSP